MLEEVTEPRFSISGFNHEKIVLSTQLLLLLIMICKHFLIVKLTLVAVCQMCTHGTVEFPTALNSLHNYDMKC